MMGARTPPKSARMWFPHAWSKVTALMLVRRSTRSGGRPSWTTLSGSVKSSAVRPTSPKPKSPSAPRMRVAFSGDLRTKTSMSPV